MIEFFIYGGASVTIILIILAYFRDKKVEKEEEKNLEIMKERIRRFNSDIKNRNDSEDL